MIEHGGLAALYPWVKGADMARFDITKTNEAVRRLLEATTNPRHRFLLAAYVGATYEPRVAAHGRPPDESASH
jgi:hypothetical protein